MPEGRIFPYSHLISPPGWHSINAHVCPEPAYSTTGDAGRSLDTNICFITGTQRVPQLLAGVPRGGCPETCARGTRSHRCRLSSGIVVLPLVRPLQTGNEILTTRHRSGVIVSRYTYPLYSQMKQLPVN